MLAPLLQSFVDQFENHFERDRPQSFWACRPAFEDLLSRGIGPAAVDAELGRLVREPTYIGDWRPAHLILHRGGGYILSVVRLEQRQRFIHSNPYYGFCASLDGQPLEYELFELPPQYRNELFDPGIKLRSLGVQRTDAGQVLELRTDGRIYDFRVTRPRLMLKLTTAAYHTLEWLFVRDTLMAWQANDADQKSTQLRVAAYLLGRLGDASSIESVKQLGHHGNHSVRWAATQALGRLSRTEGLAQLERALDDPHPHLRRAAQKALAQVSASEGR